MNGVEKSRIFPLRPEFYLERDTGEVVLGMDGKGRGATAEEVAVGWRTPQSVAKLVVGKKGRIIKVRAHSQILRIRAEDSHIRDGIGEGNLRLKDRLGVTTHFMLFSRPILPASPLGGKTAP